MALTVIQGGRHETRPDPATIRSERTGDPADLGDLLAYPLAASCAECGDPIHRRNSSVLGEWEHDE